MNRHISRAPDHEAVLDEIVAIAQDTKPDLIVHTGDVYDSRRPGMPEMLLVTRVLSELERIAPIVILCGNHESPMLFRLFDQLYRVGRVRFIEKARPANDGGILRFPIGDAIIRLAPIPFIHYGQVLDGFEVGARVNETYADRIPIVTGHLGEALVDGYDAKRDVLIFAAHMFVSGATLSYSEKPIHVGEQFATRLTDIPNAVSYAALGHIHKPQALQGSVVGRYAGSPIQMDFGEEGEQKSLVLVEAEPGRPASIRQIDLHGGRPLKTLRGTFEELAGSAGDVGKAICRVMVRTTSYQPEIADQVRALYPEADLLDIAQECEATQARVLTGATAHGEGAEETLLDLFRDYLGEVGTRTADVDRVMQAFTTLYEADQTEQEPVFAEIDALDGDGRETASA